MHTTKVKRLRSFLHQEWKLILLCCITVACVVKLFPLINYHLQQTEETRPIETGNYSDYFPNAQTQVIVLGTKSCRYCQLVREHLQTKNIVFADFDIENSAKAAQQFKLLQGKSVPLIIFKDQLIRGYSPELVDAKLNESIARDSSEQSTHQ
jgi:glutaredoxin 3